jgi:RNA polymerase sigma-70 factor, ECF subfamily
MDSGQVRSTGVNDTLAMRLPAKSPARAPDTFEVLYRSSRDDLHAYVATLLRDRAAAEDVTALAFERAYRKRQSFREERGSRRAWLFGIARNAALDELRRRARIAPLTAEPVDELVAETPLETVEAALRRAGLRSALASLDRRERELIALKFHAGLSNAEIARVIRTSETNVGTRLHRAITRLRKACDADS